MGYKVSGVIRYFWTVGISFRCERGLDEDKVNLALDKLLSSYQSEKKKIIDKMASLAKCDVYGTLI